MEVQPYENPCEDVAVVVVLLLVVVVLLLQVVRESPA